MNSRGADFFNSSSSSCSISVKVFACSNLKISCNKVNKDFINFINFINFWKLKQLITINKVNKVNKVPY